MVLYLKYRPQKIAELDSSEVRDRLAKILASSYIPHAFLLTGPKGTGKTSAARLIAKVFNCEKKKKGSEDIEPCNSCGSCTAITRGIHLDVLEIDAASNRGIDEIRDLREKIKLAPVSAAYKMYIIDEVHMLTTEAFNALLKTLEEPPARVIFILATTEPEKLPATILSRCAQFHFQKATDREMIHCLKRVIIGEKISVSEDVLSFLARSSDGSFRDGTKMLEQVIAEGALSDLTKARQVIGKDFHIEAFLRLLSEKKTKEALLLVVEMGKRGVDLRFFIAEVLHILHSLLLLEHGIDEKKIEEASFPKFSSNDLTSLIKLFSRVYTELKTASLPEIPLEVAIVEWSEE